jgi:hypothetical protein
VTGSLATTTRERAEALLSARAGARLVPTLTGVDPAFSR